jgi:hypothetical protein
MHNTAISHVEFLGRLHEEMRPRTYLEIGVQTGATFRLAKCNAVGIDPAFACKEFSNPKARLFEMTSDDFFAAHDLTAMFPDGIDFAFIDGMHLFEFALRDFMNIERFSNKSSIVAIHDCYPPNLEVAERQRIIAEWCGDVWKLLPIFTRYRPDLEVKVYDCPPVGVVLVSGLSRGNKALGKHYEEIVQTFEPLSLRDYGLKRLLTAFPALDTRHARLRHRFPIVRA